MDIFKKFLLIFKRKPIRFILSTFLSYTVIWALVDPMITLCQINILNGLPKFVFMVAMSFVIGIFKAYPKEKAKIPMRNINTNVNVMFGDLFTQKGHRVIPVNEFFDSELGDLVTPNSLHGKFIKDILGGQSDSFNALVDEALRGKPFIEVQRSRGRTRKYPIGTTAIININDIRYFLVALCCTNENTFKAEADIPELWQALSGLWDTVRIGSNGTPVYIPLIGTGMAQIRLPAKQILQIILISILHKAKVTEIASELNIVLHKDRFEEIDLYNLKKEWM